MQPLHQYFQELRGLEIPRNMLLKHIQKKDYFDNGLLHFAARYNSKTPGLILQMIDMGADIHLRNTCGATFLHVLFRVLEPEQILDYLPLLRRLSVQNFSFLSRDHWGRQPVHLLLVRFPFLTLDTLGKLEEAFAVMKPDFDALDVKGRWARTLVCRHYGRAKSRARVSEFLSTFPMSRNCTIKFAVVLSEMNGDWTAWMEWVSIEGRSAWIDSNGDTALIALLKYWDHDQDELLLPNIIKKMVGLGSQIEMRDRNGDTALAVATKRGLCLAVKSLIELQASIHITNSRCGGILRSARKEMSLAKKNGQDELYAKILNCVICLIDLEACEFPSLSREFYARWAPDPLCGWEQTHLEMEARIGDALRKSGFL
jgi:ankyrin repeat protein